MTTTTSRFTLNIAQALDFGWKATLANLRPLLLLGAVGAVLSLFNGALTGKNAPVGAGLLALFVQLAQLAVTLVMVRTALKVVDGEAPRLSPIEPLLQGYIGFFLINLVVGLVVGLGFVLLIVPGVLLALRYGYAPVLVADRNLPVGEAMRESERLTEGSRGGLFAFGLALVGVNVLGALAFGVGLLFSVPTTTIAAMYVLRGLEGRAPASLPTVTTTVPPAAPAH